MGRYLQTIRKKLAEIENGLAEPIPDYIKDSSAVADYVPRQNGLAEMKSQIGRAVLADIRSMPEEQQRRLYDEFVRDDRKGRRSAGERKGRHPRRVLHKAQLINLVRSSGARGTVQTNDT